MTIIRITKREIEEGLAHGRTLIQEEWAHPQERVWVDELVREGKAIAGPWEFKPNFQCERRRIAAAPEDEKAPDR